MLDLYKNSIALHERHQPFRLYNEKLISINPNFQIACQMKPLLPMTFRLFVALATFCAAATSAHAQGATGNIESGKKKADMCIGCHGIPGYQNSFPEIHRVPMISGQSEKYIVTALSAYKSGERKHPSMRGIAGSLSDQDMADLAAFYASQAGKTPPETPQAPSAQVAALLERGACISCHGANFNKPIDPSYPKVAGQHADYLYVALKAYTVDNGHVVGRANPIMGGMARQFKPTELRAIAQYLGSLPGELQTVPQSRFR